MALLLTTTAAAPAVSPSMINTGFRSGGEPVYEASDSESDQSAASERSMSPKRKGLAKSRKRRERKQIGALAHELGDLLGAAFTDPSAGSSAAGVASESTGQANGDQEMQVEATSAGKKMNRRTRQNLKTMEARQLKREEADMVAAHRAGLTLEKYRTQLKPFNAKRENTRQGKALGKTNAIEPRSMTVKNSRVVKKNRAETRRARKKEKREMSKAVEGERMEVDC